MKKLYSQFKSILIDKGNSENICYEYFPGARYMTFIS